MGCEISFRMFLSFTKSRKKKKNHAFINALSNFMKDDNIVLKKNVSTFYITNKL